MAVKDSTKKKKKKKKTPSAEIVVGTTKSELKALLKEYKWESSTRAKRDKGSGGTILYSLQRKGVTVKTSINFRMEESYEISQKYKEVLSKSGVAV